MVEKIDDRSKWPKIILLIASLTLVAGVCLWAISVVGLPETVRKKEFDKTRVGDLQRIHWAIDRYIEDKGELPSGLEELVLEKNILQDPETGDSYGYAVVNSKTYELSANFAFERIEDRYYSRDRETDWSHPAGLHHFSFAAKEK